MHFAKMLAGDALDMRAEVALLSRPVVIQGEIQPTCPTYNENCDVVANQDTFGGHIKVSGGWKFSRYTESSSFICV